SPALPPVPSAPRPGILSFLPSGKTGGIETSTVRFPGAVPLPLQVGQLSKFVLPIPPQTGQGEVIPKNPRTWPLPLQFGHGWLLLSATAPEPSHALHASMV